MVEALMLRLLPLLLFCVLLPSTVFAHRLDECLQSAIVAIEPEGIRLNIHLTRVVAVAEQVLTLLDRDHDGMISTDATAAYAELLKHDLQVKLDERRFALRLVSAETSG